MRKFGDKSSEVVEMETRGRRGILRTTANLTYVENLMAEDQVRQASDDFASFPNRLISVKRRNKESHVIDPSK